MEREYLAIVPIHGRTEIVRHEDLEALKEGVELLLKRPRLDYPHYDFDSQVEILRVRPGWTLKQVK